MDSPSRSRVFQAGTDSRLEAFAESISFDKRLYRQDIRGSLAHVEMLRSQALISGEEASQIRETLEQIRQEIDAGNFEVRLELEDIHMHIESILIYR
ncbi:MAG: argininosuccinate lyase, partial [Planctomycetota bacterium]